MTDGPGAAWREPARYGAGLAVLVVGTGADPFTPTPPPITAAQGHDRNEFVLLVDSGTPDGPPAGDAPVLRIGEDVGRGAAVNRAVAALPADVGLVAVAPPGLTWVAGTLDALRAAAARHPRAGVLAPRVCRPGGTAVPSAHPLPRARAGVAAVLGGRPWPPVDGPDPAGEAPVGWSSSPGLLLRRVALDSVDGFDPRYPGRLDDLDLADRLAAAGWLTVQVPSATVVCPSAVRPPAVYSPTDRPDATAARRYLADRTPRPIRALLRARPA